MCINAATRVDRSEGCRRDSLQSAYEPRRLHTSPRPPVEAIPAPDQRASYLRLLGDGSYLRFFLSQAFSSLGDWIGMIAILALVGRITHDEFAVAGMLLARLAPSLAFGPLAGVLVDRFDRKRVMVVCDVARGGLVLALPFIVSVSEAARVSPVVLLLVVSAALEMLTMLWQPAKDASVPDMVGDRALTHANALVLLAAYGTIPVSGAAFGLLATASKWLGANFEGLAEFGGNTEHLAFFFDSFTFLVSASLIATLRLPKREAVRRRLDLRSVWNDLADGVRFVAGHPRIRPWVIGIGLIFVGVGAFLAIAFFYVVEVLGAGSAGFGLMVSAVGAGLGVGFILSGVMGRLIPRDVLFSASVVGFGLTMVAFGSVSTLTTGFVVGALAGLFAGLSYPAGLTLVQENADPHLRGRTLASMHSVVRIALVGSLAAAPALARIIDTFIERFGGGPFVLIGQQIDFQGIRVVMWLGGGAIVLAGLVTTGAVGARWRGLRLRTPGIFLVFEGGEGAGKSTQIQELAAHLQGLGREVVVTREPGGTAVGALIRDLLLGGSEGVAPKTEALLYAADRSQHVDQVVRPALEAGKVVISDRYVHSSLAYQGAARSLGIDRISEISEWATEGLMPDLVFLLDFDATEGLSRTPAPDRMERQGVAFHEVVREAYQILAQREPQRFVVINASGTVEDVAGEIRRRVEPFLERAPIGAANFGARR